MPWGAEEAAEAGAAPAADGVVVEAGAAEVAASAVLAEAVAVVAERVEAGERADKGEMVCRKRLLDKSTGTLQV